MTYDDTLGDWLSSAGTMALRDRVQLLPQVPNRYGLLWSKKAVGTRDFEVRCTFSAVASDPQQSPKDAAVGFWLSQDNFAAKYKEEDIVKASKDWAEGSKQAGLNSLLLRQDYKGFGLVFLGLDQQKSPRQSATAIWSSGGELTLEDFAQGRRDAKAKFVDWAGSATTQVKVRVRPDGSIKGHLMMLDVQKHMAETSWVWKEDGINATAYLSFLKDGRVRANGDTPSGGWQALPGGRLSLKATDQQPVTTLIFVGALQAVVEGHKHKSRLEYIGPLQPAGDQGEAKEEDHWVELFSLPAGTIQGSSQETWMGFSGWTGSETSVEVNLHQLDVLNFDSTKIGEEENELGKKEAEWAQVLEHEKRYLSQASQSEAVNRLTQLLTDHVEKFNTLGEKVREDLVKMETRLDNLDMDMSTYLRMAQAWNLEDQKFDPKAVKEHIVGIRSALTKDKATHDAALDKVNVAAAQLKARHGAAQLNDEGRAKVQAVAELSRSVEDLAEKGSMQTNGLLLMMVVSVAGLGLLFLSRMRYYEKKHYI